MGQEILEILMEFGGGQGGLPGSVAIRFLLPTFFWTVLAFVAFRESRRTRARKDSYIGIAAVMGITREMLMFVAEYGSLRGFVSFGSLYPFYPPFEHMATMLTGIFIAAAFMNYLLQWRRFSRRYFLASTAVTLMIYAVTAALWPLFLRDHPGAAFGSFWGDMVYRIAAAVFMGTALAVFLYGKTQGARVQLALLTGFTFLFLDEFLMILNLATQERHVGIYAPIRHNLHIWAIPLFLGVYWSDLKHSLQKALQLVQQERSRSEAIIAAIGDGISMQDTDFRILYQNQIDKDFIGDHAGELCYQAYEKREAPCEGCPVAKTFRDGKIHRSERQVDLPDRTAFFEITASPLRDSEGRIIAGVEVVRDISERKRLHEEMAKLQKLESVGLLAGGLAHDFNNLLTSIFGNISLARMDLGADPEADERLADAERASLRAADLTRQLLTFSKGGAPVKTPRSIMEIIKESVSLCLAGSNVKAEYFVSGDISTVDVDAGQMNQVFNNLIINAVQAMPNGGAITISINNEALAGTEFPSLAQGNYVRVSVADTGTGIPEQYLSKIFDPYFTTKQKGNGLGLTTVYSIIRKHRGHITVESKSGAGTTFHIYLHASHKRELSPAPPAAPVLAGKGSILIMDDEQVVRDIAGQMLKRLGYEYVFAADGSEAIELYRKAFDSDKPFTAVILDLTVPGGIGGKEAVQRIRAMDPGARVIVSSGYSNNTIMAEYEQHGFKGVIAKPYSIQNLGKELQRVLAE